MLNAIAIVPATPLVVPELAGSAAVETAGLREAVTAAAAALPQQWLAVGAGPADGVVGPDLAGTFAGYGVDIPVTLGPTPGAATTGLPLCALIAAWIRGRVNPVGSAQVHVYADSCAPDTAVAHGRRLRAAIDTSADTIGVLVVADGVHSLGPSAPGGYRPDSVAVQRALDDALAAGDTAALTRLPDSVVGRVPYQVLAGLAGPEPRAARELFRGAPYGVGYFVGVWKP